MKKFQVRYEDSIFGGPEITVEARDAVSARKKADREVKGIVGCNFIDIRELVPVDRLEYESEIEFRDRQIRLLNDQLDKVRAAVAW